MTLKLLDRGFIHTNYARVYNTSSVNRHPRETLFRGAEIPIFKVVFGEDREGESRWYQIGREAYIWSGAVNTTRDLPAPQVKEIIFTADDFGAVGTVDDGIEQALKYGLRSIACFTNFKSSDGNTSLKKIADLLNKSSNYKPELEIGVHLTITSGNPVRGREKVPLLCRTTRDPHYEQSDFYDFKQILDVYRSYGETQRDEFITQLKDELAAQIEILQNSALSIPVQHLSVHHDTHHFHPDFHQAFQEVALDFNLPLNGETTRLPVRSINSLPQENHRAYLHLAGKLSAHHADEYLHSDPDRIRRDFCNGFQTLSCPSIVFTGHFGPIPFIHKTGFYLNRLVKKKKKAIQEAFDFLNTSEYASMEFLLHLRQGPDHKKRKTYESETRNSGYAGVNHKSFDARLAELLSFKETFENQSDPPPGIIRGSWKDVRENYACPQRNST